MNKNIFYFIIIIYLSCSAFFRMTDNYYLNQNDDKVLWSNDRKLKWEDFKGIADTTKGNAEAAVYSEIIIINDSLKNGIPKINIECNFIKSKSWTRTCSEYVLSHEQLHFDIYELYTRKIRKSFDSLTSKRIKDYQVYYDIYLDQCDKCDKYNDLYDSEVYFDSIMQKRWIKKIGIELNKLKKYECVPKS